MSSRYRKMRDGPTAIVRGFRKMTMREKELEEFRGALEK
jgi:hypothetical protein